MMNWQPDDLLFECPSCRSSVLPTLHHEYIGDELSNESHVTHGLAETCSQADPETFLGIGSMYACRSFAADLDEISSEKRRGKVLYVSPLNLRTAMEEILLRYGDDGLHDQWLESKHAFFYYNIVWWCTRLRLPLPWVSSNRGFDACVGGDRITAFARYGVFDAAIKNGALPLKILFDSINDAEEACLTEMVTVLSKCTGPVQSVRSSLQMLSVLTIKSLELRNAYLVILKLVTRGLPSDHPHWGPIVQEEEGLKSFDEVFRAAVAHMEYQESSAALPEETSIVVEGNKGDSQHALEKELDWPLAKRLSPKWDHIKRSEPPPSVYKLRNSFGRLF
jgi:hypothetical protein